MAANESSENRDLDASLKPFYQRASEAEDRLAKLEALLVKKDESENDTKISSVIEEFQSKLNIANSELASERETACKEIEMLKAENQKLQYRISHLIKALNEADSKLAACKGC
ncbi:hypothetical protein LUZ60_014035 [Juncus effusus]|nr:hypothetical protein LUZ60_014035 [Juncus effusus]